MSAIDSPNCSLYLHLNLSQNVSVPPACNRYSLEFEVFLIVVFVVLFVGTSGGNFLVITSVALVKKLQTPSNFLIVNLACSDFLVSILVLPGAVYQQINRNHWPFSELLCDVFISFDVLLCTSSILNLCAISIDRYLVITRPLQYAVKRTPRRIGTMIAISWVSSALISIPPMIGWKETFVPGECNYSDNLIYQIYATFGAFYIPLLVMLVLYSRIFKLAREMAQADNKHTLSYVSPYPQEKTPKGVDGQFINGQKQKPLEIKSLNSLFKEDNPSKGDPGVQTRRQRSKSHSDSKAIVTLGVIMGCFTICWLPFFIIQIVKSVLKVAKFDYMTYLPVWLVELCLWLGYLNSFLNPIIYVKFNREFRTPFKQILMLKCSSINARLRSETFVQEYGLSNTSKVSNCGQRQSIDQASLNAIIQSGNRRRRAPPLAKTSNRHSSASAQNSVYNNHLRPTYMCSHSLDKSKEVVFSPEVKDPSVHHCSLMTSSFQCRFRDYNMPFCSILDQRSEKCIYDFGPSSETESVDSPPLVNVSLSDLTTL